MNEHDGESTKEKEPLGFLLSYVLFVVSLAHHISQHDNVEDTTVESSKKISTYT